MHCGKIGVFDPKMVLNTFGGSLGLLLGALGGLLGDLRGLPIEHKRVTRIQSMSLGALDVFC